MVEMLAHEVKNPLSGIRGAAQLLEEGFVGRLSGQYSGRGTFSQRHAVLYDQINENRLSLIHI